MKQKMIYITDEMHEALKDESNASQLIEKLLREHYLFKKPESNKAEEIKKELQMKTEELNKIVIIEKEHEFEEKTKAEKAAKRQADSDYLKARILEEMKRQEACETP